MRQLPLPPDKEQVETCSLQGRDFGLELLHQLHLLRVGQERRPNTLNREVVEVFAVQVEMANSFGVFLVKRRFEQTRVIRVQGHRDTSFVEEPERIL